MWRFLRSFPGSGEVNNEPNLVFPPSVYVQEIKVDAVTPNKGPVNKIYVGFPNHDPYVPQTGIEFSVLYEHKWIASRTILPVKL